MKLHPLVNGGHYGWGAIRSVFDFFFPYALNGQYEYIRREAAVSIKGGRHFFTFRAFFWHYWYSLWKELAFVEVRIFEMALAPGITMPAGISFAIARDTSAKKNGAGGTNPTDTLSVTPTGSNRSLFAFCESDNSMPTAYSYNSVSLTQIDTKTATYHNYWMGYILAPSTGANNLSMTWSGVHSYDDMVAATYSGVNQSMSYPTTDAETTNQGLTATTLTTSVTPGQNNSWCIMMGADTTSGTEPTASTGANLVITGADGAAFYDSNALITPAASYSMTITFSATTLSTIMASFSPAIAAASGFSASRPLLGVG